MKEKVQLLLSIMVIDEKVDTFCSIKHSSLYKKVNTVGSVQQVCDRKVDIVGHVKHTSW